MFPQPSICPVIDPSVVAPLSLFPPKTSKEPIPSSKLLECLLSMLVAQPRCRHGKGSLGAPSDAADTGCRNSQTQADLGCGAHESHDVGVAMALRRRCRKGWARRREVRRTGLVANGDAGVGGEGVRVGTRVEVGSFWFS